MQLILEIIFFIEYLRQLGPNLSSAEFIVILVILEHALLGVVWCIDKIIPDRPLWVRIALAKADYESRQALKREVNID